MPTFDEKGAVAPTPQPEFLPKPVRVALGAAGRDVSDARLRRAVAGKVVLVTGASSGIGASAARRLGAAGATVLLVARSEKAMTAIRDEIELGGGRAQVYPTDLREPDQVDALVDRVLEDHGHVDVLVNNAGLSIKRWISESYDRIHDIERSNAINFLGPARLVVRLLPSMRARHEGQIVNVSTVGANLPAPEWSAYVATKTAFDNWLRGVAPEIAADGVDTSTIYMMMVRTPMLGDVPLYRYLPGMNPDEAAGMVARAIVTRRRVVMPWWYRVGAPALAIAPEPVDGVLTTYAAIANPASSAPRVEGLVRGARRARRIGADLRGAVGTAAQTGALRPMRPDRPVRALAAARRYGLSPATVSAAAAALWGERTAIIDEQGTLTYVELDRRVQQLAAALHHRGAAGPGQRAGVLCRNHADYVAASFAVARAGSDLEPLNTDFAGPQLGEVLARESIGLLIHDAEFEDAIALTDFDGVRVSTSRSATAGGDTVESLVALGAELPPAPVPSSPGRVVFLTSGTTGTPKGAPRTLHALDFLPMLVDGLGLAARFRPVPSLGDPVLVAPPLHHGYGFLAALLAVGAGSPMVLMERFDAERALRAIEEHRIALLCAVPTMLKRIMDLPEEVRRRYDCSSLVLVPNGAAPLPPELGTAFMDAFGDVLTNGYGSTECGAAAVALPADLRAAPGTVGRVAPGTTLKIIDEFGEECPPGVTGRIFLHNAMLFDGYTGGGTKERIGKLMSIGDIGHVDENGYLFVDGRDDDMIVSGGENVFPQEVEEMLATHEAVADAAAVGVPDPEFGKRLVAFVVLKDDASCTAEELQRHVRERLARYKVPREVHFVASLPRTSTGKIKRRLLIDELPVTV